MVKDGLQQGHQRVTQQTRITRGAAVVAVVEGVVELDAMHETSYGRVLRA